VPCQIEVQTFESFRDQVPRRPSLRPSPRANTLAIRQFRGFHGIRALIVRRRAPDAQPRREPLADINSLLVLAAFVLDL